MATTNYEDIIDLPRPVSKKHPPMPMAKRAAQFLPFAALTGFEGEIAEAARLTESVPELGEDALLALDEQLSLLRQRLRLVAAHGAPGEDRVVARHGAVSACSSS